MTCDGNPVPPYGRCNFECDPGYELSGFSWDICINSKWLIDTPTCKRKYIVYLLLKYSSTIGQLANLELIGGDWR